MLDFGLRKQALASPTTHQSFMRALSLSKTKRLSKRLLERLTALYIVLVKPAIKYFFVGLSFLPARRGLWRLRDYGCSAPPGKRVLFESKRKSLSAFQTNRLSAM